MMEQDRAALGKLHPLADGGQAVIYRIPEYRLDGVSDPLVYKEYRAEVGVIRPHSLRSILRIRSDLPHPERVFLDSVSVWPLQIVVEDGTVRGVVMREIPASFIQAMPMYGGAVEHHPRAVQFLMVEKRKAELSGIRFASLRDRLIVCAKLAYVLAFLHKREVTFGDISASNVLFRLDPDPAIMLVDCDAVRKRGAAAIVGQLHTPDWIPPEGSDVQSINTDLYKLGLFILRTLSPGVGSSVNTDPGRVRRALDARGIDMLRRALEGVSGDRPTAKEWHNYLRHVLQRVK